MGTNPLLMQTSGMTSRLYTLEQIHQAVTTAPDQWRPLVLTNGCFDLLHVGHVRYLEAAKCYGKSLVVGLNSDRSVRQLKTTAFLPRPLQPSAERAEILAALRSVDAVVIFDELTAQRLIESLQPEIYVKGGDYCLETLPETPYIQAYGGQIQFVPIEVATSTSKIIKQILQTRTALAMPPEPASS